MDLVAIQPAFNLYNRAGPSAPASTTTAGEVRLPRRGQRRVGIATESLVSGGCIISGGRIHRSVLSNRCRVNSFSEIEESVLFEDVVSAGT